MTCQKAPGDAPIGHESFGEQHPRQLAHVLRSFLPLLRCRRSCFSFGIYPGQILPLHRRGEVGLGLKATTGETGHVGSGLGRSGQGGSQQTAACARGHGCARVCAAVRECARVCFPHGCSGLSNRLCSPCPNARRYPGVCQICCWAPPGPVPCSREQLQKPERGFQGECAGCGSPAADQGNTRDCVCVCVCVYVPASWGSRKQERCLWLHAFSIYPGIKDA